MNFGIGGPVRLASTFMVSCCALAPSAIAAIAARTAGTSLGPVTKQLCQPLSNVRGSDALSEPRTLESGCRRLDWLFPDRRCAGNRRPGTGHRRLRESGTFAYVIRF